MKREIGLWLDHRDAIIVILTDGGEEIKHLTSGNGKHIRYSGSSHSKTPEGLKRSPQKTRGTENLRTNSTNTTMRSLQVFAMQTPSRYLALVRQKVNWKHVLGTNKSKDRSLPSKPLTR